MRKSLWIGGVLAVLAGGLAIVVFLVDFDSPRLGKVLLDQVGAQTGLRAEADGFRLNLWRGLRLDGFRCTVDGPSGRLTVKAASLLGEHRLPALLRGRVVIHRVVVDRPRVELVTPADAAPTVVPVTASSEPFVAAPAPAAAADDANPSVLSVDRISVRDGTLSIRVEGAPAPDLEIRGLEVELRGLALDAAPTALAGLRAEGDLHTREILLGGMKATEGNGKLRLAAGHFLLADFAMALPQGPFHLKVFDADLTRDPLAYRLDLGVDPLDADAVMAAGSGGGFGPGVLAFRATGIGTETRDMTGEGTLHLAAGRVPGSPLFAAIETALGRADLKGSAYEPFAVRFRIEKDRLHLAPSELRTSLLALGISGWADLAGPLDLRIAVRAPRDAVARARVPAYVLELVDDGGWVTVPLRIAGTAESPRITPDAEALRALGGRAVRRAAEREVRKGLNKAFGKLFGRR